MGSLPAPRRFRLSVLFAVLAGLMLMPATSAFGADCTISTANGAGNDTYLSQTERDNVQIFKGNFKPDLNGQFIQIPFDVPDGTTGMRIRYCYDGADTTLDLGVYEPATNDDWSMDELRGWSGSAVRAIGIGENGYTSEPVYLTGKKRYVPGNTSRAFKAGHVPVGKWAVELGAGWIKPALTEGTNWKVEVVTSTDEHWANDEFVRDPYEPYTANPNPGWYQGDVHVHGEHEPGNALMTDTFKLAFDPPNAPGDYAPELDFITLVDHNNTIARSMLGSYEDEYKAKGKLIIPGTEVTTYNGHFNSQNADEQADFRLSSIYRFSNTANTDSNDNLDQSDLDLVRGPSDPSGQFDRIINEWGGWSQINHPEHFVTAPALCRGCAWNYSDAQTDFSKVSSIEVQSGPAGLGGLDLDDPLSMSAFTRPAIAFYERALATGAHIAAVGSSDDHQAGKDLDGFSAPVGRATTVVHANELSQAGVTKAVRDGHTWVKLFGADAPDIDPVATVPGKPPALPGDSRTGKNLTLSLKVTGVDDVPRTATAWSLDVLRNGVKVDSAPISGDELDYSYNTSETGRYSFQLNRQYGTQEMIEAYSTPVWFTRSKPVSNRFSFGKVKLNRKKGTARLKVKVAGAGKIRMKAGSIVNRQAKSTAKKRVVNLTVKPKGKLKRKLRKRGTAKVRVKVTFNPKGGKARTKQKTVKLKMKKKRKRSKKR